MAKKSSVPQDEGVVLDKAPDPQIQLQYKKIEGGWMGRLLGLGQAQPANIAGFSIVIASIMIIVIGLVPFYDDVPRRELIMLIASIIPASLGYYFGSISQTKAGRK